MTFVLIFDLPREAVLERKKVNLMLKRSGSKMIQFSVWSNNNLKELIPIALFIRDNGGQAKY